MSKFNSGNRNVSFAKVLAIAIMFSMALSAIPMAVSATPVAASAAPAHVDACECGHDHEACACGHEHEESGHDACECEDCCGSDDVMALFSAGGGEILTLPVGPTTSGFPVTLDQSSTSENCTYECGNKPGPCPICNGHVPAGSLDCGVCGGDNLMPCTRCSGTTIESCPTCGGDGLMPCTICDGDQLIQCLN